MIEIYFIQNGSDNILHLFFVLIFPFLLIKYNFYFAAT